MSAAKRSSRLFYRCPVIIVPRHHRSDGHPQERPTAGKILTSSYADIRNGANQPEKTKYPQRLKRIFPRPPCVCHRPYVAILIRPGTCKSVLRPQPPINSIQQIGFSLSVPPFNGLSDTRMTIRSSDTIASESPCQWYRYCHSFFLIRRNGNQLLNNPPLSRSIGIRRDYF